MKNNMTISETVVHSFHPAVAADVGVNAAVLFYNICFWVAQNAANERNLQNGKYWTYNSVTAYARLFPEFSEKQIRTALNKLEESGYIESGCFNENPMDKTKWYTVTDRAFRFVPVGQIDSPNKADVNNIYSNIDNTTDNKQDTDNKHTNNSHKSNALSERTDKDGWNASFQKKEGVGGQNSFHKGHITDYTDKQLIEHIDKVVDYNMQPYWELYFVDGEWKTRDNNYPGELKKIILYFYQKYKEVVGKNHPIISDFGYTKIVDEYMENPPDDDVWEFEDYKRMIDKYFTVEFGRNKKPKNKIELSLSHFMSKTIREHLYYQTEPVC